MAGLKGLDKQDITFDFGQGSEQKADSKRVPIGALTVADNVMFTKDKALRRRYGTEQFYTYAAGVQRLIPAHGINTVNALTNYALATPPSGVLQIDSDYNLIGAGYSGEVQTGIIRGATLPMCATAATSTYTVTAYLDVNSAGGTVSLLLQDTVTKKVIDDETVVTGTTITAVEQVHVMISGSTAYVFYRNAGIYCCPVTLSATAASAGTPVAIIAAGTTYSNGWAVQQDGTSFYIAYRNSVPVITLQKRTLAAPGVTVWSNTLATAGADTAVCLAQLTTTPTAVWCYFAETGAVRYFTCNATTGAGTANGTYQATAYGAGSVIGMCAYYAGTNLTMLITVASGTTYGSRQWGSTAALTASDFGGFFRSEVPCSGIFPLDSTFSACLVRNSGFVYLITLNPQIPSMPLARVAQEVDPYTTKPSDNTWSNAMPYALSAEIHFPLWLVKESRATAAGLSACVFGEAVIDRTYAAASLAVPSAAPSTSEDEAYFGGLAAYAGTDTSGLLYPPKPAVSGTAGSLDTAVTYRFYACATYTDVRGKKHYSPLGTVAATGSAGYTVSMNAPPTPYTTYAGKRLYNIEIYMNPANTDLWYKVRTITLTASTIAAGVSATITTEPAGTEELLYTTGSAYESIPPALPRWVTAARKRLWAPSPENDTNLYFSSEPIIGQEARWNPAEVVRIPDSGGRITAVVEHNQRVVVFKEHAIYVLSGDGPSLNGQGGSFGVELLSTSYGCESQVGVLSIPQGLLFKTVTNGWWLMGNDYSFTYTGRGVDSYKTTTVAASCVVENQNQARFLLTGVQDSSTGGVLCYDYAYGQWTRFEYAADVTDMCVGNDGEVYYLYSAATSRVFKEDADVYTDVNSSGASVDYPMRFTTGWLNFNGVDGFQRVRYMDLQSSIHDEESAISFAVAANYDYDNASDNIDTGTIALGSNSAANRQANRMYFRRQKCLAVKIAFVLGGTKANIADRGLTALVFRVAGKTTAAPAASGQRTGTIP